MKHNNKRRVKTNKKEAVESDSLFKKMEELVLFKHSSNSKLNGSRTGHPLIERLPILSHLK